MASRYLFSMKGCQQRMPRNQIFLNHNIIYMKKSESHSFVSDSLRPHGLYSLWNSPTRILEWEVIPFSRGSSQLKDQIQVPHIAGRFFTS